jgi:hypothetical protein
MNFKIGLFVFLFVSKIGISQTNHQEITFCANYGNEKLELNSVLKIGETDSIKIESLRFYVSNIRYFNQSKLVWKEDNSYHLIDFSNEGTLKLSTNIPDNLIFTQLVFNLGIDSVTNTSGVMGKDLDPIKGMYWTWQSGYINFKLEGTSNLCKTRNNEFQFHLGGYQNSDNCLNLIKLDVSDKHTINIYFDVKQFLTVVDLKNKNHIMSPGTDAVHLSEELSKLFISK